MGRRETYMDRAVFEALAKGFRATKPKDSAQHTQWVRDVAVVAGICKSFNAAFLRERFFADCGVEMKGDKS